MRLTYQRHYLQILRKSQDLNTEDQLERSAQYPTLPRHFERLS
jgi:hypothetical protein